MNKNTGGPAFPRPIGEYKVQGAGKYNDAQKGMTLRDYFAAAAMQGALAGEPGGHLIPDRLAANSYRYADAMLAARECEQAALPQAEQPEAGRDFKQGAEREPPVVTGQVRKIEPPVTIYRQRKANGSTGIYLEDQRSHLCECETDVDAWGIANALNATTRPQEQGKPTSAACSRCHTVEGDCDALVSDDPTACPCRCHEPQVQEAGRDECQRCEGYGEIPIEDLDVPCGACKGTGKAAPPANAEAVRLLRELRDAARAYWDGGMVGAAEKRDRFRLALRAADAYIAATQKEPGDE